MPSKEFHELLDKMREIHDKKSIDYSTNTNPFSNFNFSASIVMEFKYPIDQVFVTLISIKLSRLSNLLSNKLQPLNESIEDSFIDLANYCLLWAAHYKNMQEISINKSVPPSQQPQE